MEDHHRLKKSDKLTDGHSKKRTLSARSTTATRKMTDSMSRSESRMSVESCDSQEKELAPLTKNKHTEGDVRSFSQPRASTATPEKDHHNEIPLTWACGVTRLSSDYDLTFRYSQKSHCPKLPPIEMGKGALTTVDSRVCAEDIRRSLQAAGILQRNDGIKGRIAFFGGESEHLPLPHSRSPLPAPRLHTWNQYSSNRGLTEVKIDQKAKKDIMDKADRIPQRKPFDEDYEHRQAENSMVQKRQRRLEKKAKRKQKRDKEKRRQQINKRTGKAKEEDENHL